MNTTSKRLSATVSLSASYLAVLLVAIFLSTFVMNRNTPKCIPVVHIAEPSYAIFTPNIDITSTMNYNVKEAFIYLVHQIEIKGVELEQVVWSTLAKKEKNYVLIKECKAKSNDANKPLTKGKFILKGSYFPYIGVIKSKTFAEFPCKVK
ncbi:uncharacterized protein NESG_02107 [Nematocida ausubeli]|uniref:Uncharacterized protein n=1 Tax=Nematocida ausubeli (strain ATCC PRA-371 / ERTm2) TaxID=1913371 RepID=A0A086IZL7_NEMA1|nr:uncharacterized protein NESG_02107 [Nematocida ausubeli]KAI5135824.1 signal peptidase complex subunit 3 [Nematocida ausubeli]KFG25335.1 hypothetical protein NESG_02107 [Nematocida ausubeli]